MTIALNEKQFKTLIKEGVKEALDSELLKLRAFLLPFVSEKEQKEIERMYKKPSRKSAEIHRIEN